MDGPIEKMVKRKHDIVDQLSVILVILAAVIVQMLTLAFNFFIQYIAIVLAVLLFICTKFVLSKNIEFEYSYFNGDLEIDKIINKKKRMRVVLVSIKDFEAFGQQKAFSKITSKPGETIYCSSLLDSQENYFFIANYNSKRTAFFFEPNEQIINDITKKSPQKIIRGE